MALTLQPIRGFPQHSGEMGTQLTTVLHSHLFSQFFSEGGGTSVHRLLILILHFTPSLHFTLSLQSAFYTQSAFYPWSVVCSLQSAVCVLH